MESEITWPLVCVIAGFFFILVEVCVPSAGLFGLLAAGLLLWGLFLAFSHSTALGIRFLVGTGLALPAVLSLGVYLWPRTPLARRMALEAPGPAELIDVSTEHRLDHLIGQYGRAVTPLRPAGLVRFEDRRLDAQAEDGLIPAGTLVRAVDVRGARLIVRPAEAHLADALGA